MSEQYMRGKAQPLNAGESEKAF